MTKNVIHRAGRWFSKNLLEVLAIITTILVAVSTIYLTADLGDLASRYRAFREWASPAVEFVTSLIVVAAALATVTVILVLFRKLAATARRIAEALYYRHVRAIQRLCEDRDSTSQHLAIIEERLRIGVHPMLNLPDNLVPEEIEFAVRRYGREQHFKHLWEWLRPTIACSVDGYVVLDQHGSGGRATHYKTREAAEQNFNRNPTSARVLVHVIEADWDQKSGG